MTSHSTPALRSYCERDTVWLTYVLLHLMRLTIWCALCMKKKQLAFNFCCCTLWSEKYGSQIVVHTSIYNCTNFAACYFSVLISVSLPLLSPHMSNVVSIQGNQTFVTSCFSNLVMKCRLAKKLNAIELVVCDEFNCTHGNCNCFTYKKL